MPDNDSTGTFPTAIEELLRRAAADSALADLLFQDLDAAIVASGLTLSGAELAIVRSVSPDELRQAIDRLAAAPPNPSMAPPEGFAPQGIRPDRPSPSVAPAGIRPDREPPSYPALTGISPDRPHVPKRPGFFARLFRRKK